MGEDLARQAIRALVDFFTRQHAVEAVLCAAALCFLTALIGFRALVRWRDGPARERALWLWLALGAFGAGVWCTHFLAMLGYRPDLALAFSAGPTLASAAIALVGVGAPMALGAHMRRPLGDAAGGLGAGVATAAMHGVGVAGLTGFIPLAAPLTSAGGALLGACCFAVALRTLRSPGRLRATTAAALFAAGVAGLHFVTLSGFRLEQGDASSDSDFTRATLVPIIVMISVTLLAALTLVSVVGRRSAREHDRLSAVALHTSNMVMLLDPAGGITWANPALTRRTGLTSREVVGRQPFDALPPRAPDCAAADALRDAIAARRREAQDLQLRTVGGDVVWAHAALNPVFDVDGRISAMVLILNDVTEAKAREAAFAAARDRAEQASRAKSEFMSIMSHELRTPLNAVIGFSSLLALDPLTERQKRQAETIGASARALLAIVNDILEFAADSAEAGATAPCALGAMTEALQRDFAGRAAEKGLALSFVIDPALPASPVLDGPGLEGALRRLIDNALKFTAQGGVTVSLRAGDEPRLRRIVAEVSDTGPGVPPDLLARLRGGFAQLDASATRRGGGVGLGLALVGRVLERMDAQLFVESAPGGGATFRIEAPAGEPPAATRSAALSA